jgi:hypothetical protein
VCPDAFGKWLGDSWVLLIDSDWEEKTTAFVEHAYAMAGGPWPEKPAARKEAPADKTARTVPIAHQTAWEENRTKKPAVELMGAVMHTFGKWGMRMLQ